MKQESEGGEKNPSDCNEEGQEFSGEIWQIDSDLCKAYMSRALLKEKPCFQFLKSMWLCYTLVPLDKIKHTTKTTVKTLLTLFTELEQIILNFLWTLI